MNGYLQRLASSVLDPGGSIHPVLTPVFSTPAYAAAPQPLDVETVAAPAPYTSPAPQDEHRAFPPRTPALASHPSPSASPETAAGPRIPITLEPPSPAQPPLVAQAPQRTEPQSQAEPNPEEKLRFRPLVSVRQTDEDETGSGADIEITPKVKAAEQHEGSATRFAAEGMRSQPEPSILYVEPITAAAPPPVEGKAPNHIKSPLADAPPGQLDSEIPPPGQPVPAVIFRDRFVPLVAKKVDQDDALTAGAEGPKQRTTPVLKPASVEIRNRPLRDLLSRPMAPVREPDEIQIHIGRIEVIATPPAPSRPAAAKTARKTPTLDEYLKQRHGRA